MSDPDLYSTDPWRREAARIREQNLRSSSSWNRPTHSSSGNSSNDNIGWKTPSYDTSPLSGGGAASGGGALGFGLIGALGLITNYWKYIAVGTGAIASAAGVFYASRAILNYKDGFDLGDSYNNKLAGWITAGFCTVAGASGAMLYEDYKQRLIDHPSIAVAFNNNGRSFVARNPDAELARQSAISLCNSGTDGWIKGCRVRAWVEAGEEICLHYSSAAASNGHGRYYIDRATGLRPDSGSSPLNGRCYIGEMTGLYDSRQCLRNTRTACNF